MTPLSFRNRGVFGRSDIDVPGRAGRDLAFWTTISSIFDDLRSRDFAIACAFPAQSQRYKSPESPKRIAEVGSLVQKETAHALTWRAPCMTLLEDDVNTQGAVGT